MEVDELEFETPLEEVEEADVKTGRNKIFTDQGDPEIDRTYATRSRRRRKYVLVGLTTAIQAADTSCTSYPSPVFA